MRRAPSNSSISILIPWYNVNFKLSADLVKNKLSKIKKMHILLVANYVARELIFYIQVSILKKLIIKHWWLLYTCWSWSKYPKSNIESWDLLRLFEVMRIVFKKLWNSILDPLMERDLRSFPRRGASFGDGGALARSGVELVAPIKAPLNGGRGACRLYLFPAGVSVELKISDLY